MPIGVHRGLREAKGAVNRPAGARVWQVLCLVVPFALFSWCLPFVGSSTIGQDYPVYSIQGQLELQWALSKGQFPLYHPGVAAGAPTAVLTLGGLYHPLTHLAAHLPGFTSGHALDWMTLVRLLTLAAAHLGFWRALCALGMGQSIAWLVALATVYNLRALDLFRYGASLEAYTGMILACGFVIRAAVEPARGAWFAAVAISVFATIASGHPQMAYYGVVATGIVWLCAPFVASAVGIGNSTARRQYFAQTGAALVVGVMLSAAYWLPFMIDYMAGAPARVGRDRNWALTSNSPYPGPLGLLRMLFWPFKADVHGSFAGTLFPVAIIAGAAIAVVRRQAPVVIVCLLGVILTSAAYALGDHTPVHRLLWAVLPFESNLRAPARMLMVVPVPLALLFAWLWQSRRPDVRWWSNPLAVGGMAAATLGVVLTPWLAMGPAEAFAPEELRSVPQPAQWLWLASALAGGLWLARAAMSADEEPRAAERLLFVTALGLAIALRYGTWISDARPTLSFEALGHLKSQSVEFHGGVGTAMYASDVLKHLDRAPLQPDLARLSFDVEWVNDSEAAYRRLSRGRLPTRAIAERPNRAPALDGAPVVSDRAAHGSVVLVFMSGNRQDYAVESTAPGLFSAAVPFADGWRISVDDEAVTTLRVDGLHLGAVVPAGRHTVSLRWVSPAVRIGLGISLAGLAALLIWILPRLAPAEWSYGAAAIVAVAVSGGAAVLAARLEHGGESWGTRYAWDSRHERIDHNLLLGRPALGSVLSADFEDRHRSHPSRAVDGSAQTFFASHERGERWWAVRLTPPARIATLELEGVGAAGRVADLEIALEDAAGAVKFTRRISGPDGSASIVVPVEPEVVADLVRVRRVDPKGRLILAEVRAYDR